MPRHVRELKSLPCITTLSALKGQPWQFQDASGDIVKVPVRSRYRVNSGELAVAGAREGIGFAIVAAYPCQDDLATGRLQEVSLDLCPAPLQLLGAYSHRHSVTARVRALLDLIQGVELPPSMNIDIRRGSASGTPACGAPVRVAALRADSGRNPPARRLGGLAPRASRPGADQARCPGRHPAPAPAPSAAYRAAPGSAPRLPPPPGSTPTCPAGRPRFDRRVRTRRCLHG
ncbi:hypothetical protein G6F57_018704 [Rhizopus arrhizus]|nr:hypothetical protein G6F57_018704 [Rhizopus arrhizus]